MRNDARTVQSRPVQCSPVQSGAPIPRLEEPGMTTSLLLALERLEKIRRRNRTPTSLYTAAVRKGCSVCLPPPSPHPTHPLRQTTQPDRLTDRSDRTSPRRTPFLYFPIFESPCCRRLADLDPLSLSLSLPKKKSFFSSASEKEPSQLSDESGPLPLIPHSILPAIPSRLVLAMDAMRHLLLHAQSATISPP